MEFYFKNFEVGRNKGKENKVICKTSKSKVFLRRSFCDVLKVEGEPVHVHMAGCFGLFVYISASFTYKKKR